MMRRVLAWTVVLATLTTVFTAYLRPVFVVNLANQLWNCF
jgi:hypothetical protein